MIPYSILDLAPIPEGGSEGDALRNTLDLAVRAEGWGYHRYWLAEHHGMPGIASSATAVLIGQVAARTSHMRIGSGGIMLPNHAPLIVAEQFGTLATLYPGRIDLGLGRAPGTDARTMRALRRHMAGGDTFPQDVQDLLGYFSDRGQVDGVRAIPGRGTHVPVWLLGSSLYGAELAALLGLPYAFASHFAPAALELAIEVYRGRFQPSDYLQAPYFMLAANVFAGESDAEGAYLMTSSQLAFANLGRGRPSALPRPVEDIARVLAPAVLDNVNAALAISASGGPDRVARQLRSLIERYRPDEVMLSSHIHDHASRLRSLEIAADALAGR
ncbi:MAG: LLM class flavin-dependent oxidoreductase [Rhodobacteraceae bacterium]|nr:LLM class flavin-dependent oxidoreductase [Paracoccaceae bacterium]